jgi:hypothetical protein
LSTIRFTFDSYRLAETIRVWDFYESEKTSNHAIELLKALSSSYKTLISLSFGFALFFFLHLPALLD